MKLNLDTFLLLLSFSIVISAVEKTCTSSGHRCISTNSSNPDPCRSGERVLKIQTCENKHSEFIRGYCDYCPEVHEASDQLTAGSYRSGVTACRQEDGFYKCQLGGADVNCVRRTWIRRLAACHDYDELSNMKLNCTDDEIRCRLQDRCLKRYDINSEMGCDIQSRQFHISCHHDEFQCKISRKCLPLHWVRDGSVDCSIFGEVDDVSDESAPLSTCTHQFRCQDAMARCIPREMVMDGRANCQNGSDEMDAIEDCLVTEFRCTQQGRCIPRYRVNDGFPDCPEASDEDRAGFECRERMEFDCGDGRCIPRAWVGNKLVDCKSGIDERVKLTECLSTEFGCLDGTRCLPRKFLCDGIQNCHDCSDEIELCDEPRRFRCKSDPSMCIAWTHTCDAIHDCDDGSDEEMHLLQGFKCHSHGKPACYVPQFMIHNNVSMCADRANLCYNDAGEFSCARCLDGKTIISTEQICDGLIDCADLSDECPCRKNTRVKQKVCDVILNPITNNATMMREKMVQVCNGRVEWEDSSDEKFCFKESSSFNVVKIDTVKVFDHWCRNISDYLIELSSKFGLFDHIYSIMSLQATKCDGVIECMFFEDECNDECDNQHVYCDTIPQKLWGVPGDPTGGGELTRTCVNAATIYDSLIPPFLCDGLQHCEGGEDEAHCPDRLYCDAGTGSTLLNGIKPIISIHKSQSCDLKVDCLDASDERNCSSKTHFYCNEGAPVFIERSRYLDGHADCFDYSDECPMERYKQNLFSSPTELLDSIVLRVFIWVAGLLSVFGNMWVLLSTARKLKKLRCSEVSAYCNRMLIANLALADLLTGTCLWILIVKSQQFSGEYCLHEAEWKMSVTCNMIGTLLVISSEASLNIMVSLTAMRLFTVIKPIRSKTMSRKTFYFLASISWFIAAFLGLYPILDAKRFSGAIKISKNRYFQNSVIDHNSVEEYYRVIDLINDLNSPNTSTSSFNPRVDDESTRITFPERVLHVEGEYGYYSSNSVCFPNYFQTSTSENHYSLCVIVYNTIALLFIAFSYVVFYKKSSRKTVAATHGACSRAQRNNSMKKKISLLVLTSMACWLPICVMAFYNLHTHKLHPVVYVVVAVVILPIDSCFNPIIYSQIHSKAYKSFRHSTFVMSLRKKKVTAAAAGVNKLDENI